MVTQQLPAGRFKRLKPRFKHHQALNISLLCIPILLPFCAWPVHIPAPCAVLVSQLPAGQHVTARILPQEQHIAVGMLQWIWAIHLQGMITRC
jgi:hypothetical protein